MTRNELEELLGDPASYVLKAGDARWLREWAISAGNPAVSVNIMPTVELVNLYHASAENDKPIDDRTPAQMASDIFVAMLANLSVPGFEVELTRRIAREAVQAAHTAMRGDLEALWPKSIHVVTPRATVTLDGTLHYRTELCIRLSALGHSLMLVGPAGCGKTTIGAHVARALSLPFYVTSTINDTHELTGFIDGMGRYHDTPFRRAYQTGGVWIADEIDAWDASALLAANSALANGFATFPDLSEPLMRHPDFRMIATANTFGNGADRVYIGRNELDAASLDRFATINVDYDLTLEQSFATRNQKWLERVWAVRKIVTEKRIRHVVSSRAIILGGQALDAGVPWPDVEEIYLFKGMSAADREKLS